MDKPEMIFFDYGHTLCYEPVQDYPAGWAEVMRHAVRNPRGVTAASLAELMTDIYSRVWGSMRPHELETDGFKLDAEIYESLGLAFDVSLEELEYLRWRATEPIYPMEGVEAFLELRVAVRVYPVEFHLFKRAPLFYLAAQRRKFIVVRLEFEAAFDCGERPGFVAEVGAQLGGLKPAPRV